MREIGKTRSPRGMRRRAVFAIALPVLLAGCAGGALENYDLSAVPPTTTVQARKAVISVEEPSAPEIIASNRIAIRRPGSDYAYLSGAQWADQLTQLVQRRVIQSFENARLFQAVAETGMAADYILSLEIRRFDIDSAAGEAVVEIGVRLLTSKTGKTVQGTIASGRAPAPANGAAEITAALDAAFGQAAAKILQFAVSRT